MAEKTDPLGLGPGLILWYNVSNGKGYEIWNLEREELYRSGSLMTVVRELARYKLDLVGL
jgi:hypothetical protein